MGLFRGFSTLSLTFFAYDFANIIGINIGDSNIGQANILNYPPSRDDNLG